MKTTYIAISFGFWGRGDTEKEALSRLKKAGGGFPCRVSVNEHGDDQAAGYVDGYGNTHYHGTLRLVAKYPYKGKRNAA